MKNNAILRWHLALLLLDHGEKSVIRTLADLVGKPPSELEAMLQEINKVGRPRIKKASSNRPSGSITTLMESHPEKAAIIQALKERYDNRTLFPELKDVRRFLERHAQTGSALKSRVDASTKIVRVLIGLPLHELETMLSIPENKELSSLGVISDQILGHS